MIDIESMQDTFAISWITKLGKDGNGSWRIIPKYYYSKLSPGLTVFKCSSSEKILGYLEDDWKIINIYCIVAKHAINVYKKSIETQEDLLTIYDREKLLRCL